MKIYHRKRILLVDDEPQTTALLDMYLQRNEAYQVRVVNSSTQAVAVAKEFQPDLIVLDLDMPGISGSELAIQFRESPRFKATPLLLYTGAFTKEEVSRNGGKLGGLPAMAKPAGLMEVLDTVRAHLAEPQLR